MSFSRQVKEELVKNEYEKACCRKAFLYGMCIFGKSFSSQSVSLQTETPAVSNLYCELLQQLFNIKADLKISPRGRNYTAYIEDGANALKLLRAFGHDGVGSIKINHTNFDCEECANAFISGAFLSCGTISNPQKDYHLEFIVPFLNLSKSLLTLLEEKELKPKYNNRYGYNIVYFKESESIENCLYIMGASSAMFEMMNIQIIKDFRNKANRMANCETANINKMVNAVSIQLEAIDKIWKLKGREFLPESLEQIAELRCENPDLSLNELAALSNPKLSRSGINHRLKRIVDISKEL